MNTFTRAQAVTMVIFFILSWSSAVAQNANSRTLTYDDPQPQHYQLTARASEIDKRVKPHPDIGFLIETNGKPADIQHASVERTVE